MTRTLLHRPTLHRPMARASILAAAFSLASGLAAASSAQKAVPAAPIVLVVGDRFATALADGLETNAGIVVARTTGDGFGLTRPGFDDSLGTIRERLARADKPSLAAMIVGVDDHEPLTDGTARVEPGTPGWQKIYGERVDAIAKLFHDANVPLVWVGLPAVRSPDLSADFVRQNGIVRDHVTRDGAAYVDSFDAFTDAAGRYSPVGPDADGTVTKLRRAGGLGFTHAGAKKLASFLAPDIARLGRNSATASAATLANLTVERARDFDAALDVDVNAQIRREAARGGTPAAPVAGKAAVLSAAVTGAAVPSPVTVPPPQGPAAGPVLPLTGAPLASDGQLASLTLPASVATEPKAPKPGRTDDFSWPKP